MASDGRRPAQHLVLTRNGMPRRFQRLAWVGVGLIILTGVIVLSRLSPYRPGLAAAPGYAMHNLTEPDGLAAGYIKELQALLDVTPCTYEILGWGPDSALYYRAVCHGQLQVWRVNPDQPDHARSVYSLPNGLFTERLPKSLVLDRVRVPAVRPLAVEPWVREVNLRSEGYPSPDGRWLAIVAERVYGPQDVLLLTDRP